jgi:hypothetical protein
MFRVPRGVSHLFFRILVCAQAALVCCFAAPGRVGAGEAEPGPSEPRFEAWTGAEVFSQVWSLYAGATYAPFGSVRQDGLRVRAVAGYGAYWYTSQRWTGSAIEHRRYHGSTTFADLLAGYQQQLGALTIKILGGLALVDRSVDDPDAPSRGIHAGGKAVIEAWWNVTDEVWASADLSWSTLDNVYGSRTRIGWRWWPQLSVGVEAGATGSWDFDTARLGGFVRYEWATGELSVSGGISGDGPSNGFVDAHGAFATVNAMVRF